MSVSPFLYISDNILLFDFPSSGLIVFLVISSEMKTSEKTRAATSL